MGDVGGEVNRKGASIGIGFDAEIYQFFRGIVQKLIFSYGYYLSSCKGIYLFFFVLNIFI